MSSDKIERDSSPLLMLPDEVCDLIFQHLTGELLKMSEVSPSFYNFVAGSKRCMGKIKMELQKMESPAPSVLMNSVRKYECVRIYKSHIKASREILSVAGRSWKDVCISEAAFETVNDFLDYFRVFQCSVEKLSLNCVYVKRFGRNLDPCAELPLSDLQFTKLKSLEMAADVYDKAFVNCKNLTSLSIDSKLRLGPSSLDSIRTLLESNGGLTFLKIGDAVFNPIFSEDFLKESGLQLKEFHGESQEYTPGGIHVSVPQNFNAFLKSQIETLETLTLRTWMGVDALKLVLPLPHLKDVTVKGFKYPVDPEVPKVELEGLPPNDSVVNLTLPKEVHPFQALISISEAFPNLESLKIANPDETFLDWLAKA